MPDASSPTTRYISASGVGAGDGSSSNNAAALNQTNLDTLTQAMSLVEGGTVVFVGALTSPAKNADIVSGEYLGLPGGYTINHSCTIEGMKHPLNPDTSDWAYPTFCGTRFPYLLPASKGTGFDTTGLAVGELGFIVNAEDVTIRQFNARRMGTVVKQSFNGTSHGLTLEDWQVYNVQRFQDQPINIRATATATFSGNPTAGESITLSGNTLTFVASVTDAETEVAIGATRTITLASLRTLVDLRYQALGCQATVVNSTGVVTFSANLTGADGNGTVTISRTGSTITLSANNVSGGVTVSNNDLTIRRVTGIGCSKAFTRFAGSSSGMVLEDIYLDSGWQKNDSFARLVSAVDKASNITVTDCTCLNIYEEDNTYWNGDGYNVDDGNANVSLVNVSMSDSTDGGADFKGLGHTITNANFTGCKRSFRIWGDVEVIGGSSTNPHNSGTTTTELGNGSAHVFVNGYFNTTVDRGSDPFAPNGFNPTGASQYRGVARFIGTHFEGDGDAAGDGDPARQATRLIFTGGPGAICQFVNATRRSPTTTGGLIESLTAANAGPVSVALGSKVTYFTGDPEDIDCLITTDLTQNWPEGSYVAIPLEADIAGARGAVYTDCFWGISNASLGSVTLSSWAHHRPTLSFLAPPNGGAPVTVDLTVIDAAGNGTTQTMSITSDAVGPTDPPVYAGAGTLTATETIGALSVTPDIPSQVAVGDIILLVAHTSLTTAAPTVPLGYALIASQLQSGTIKSYLYWKEAGALEPDPTITFDTAIASATQDIHAGICLLMRNCRLGVDPFEHEVATADTTSDTVKVGPTSETEAGNRTVLNIFVLNKDIGNADVSGTGWTDVLNVNTTTGKDMSIVVARKTVAAITASVTGADLTWDLDIPDPNDRNKTTSQQFALALLPEIDP